MATVINSTTVHLTWSPPFTLNITGDAQPSILGYRIEIRVNGSEEIVQAANSTVNEYYYTPGLSGCLLAALEVSVAGRNGLGTGAYSQAVTSIPTGIIIIIILVYYSTSLHKYIDCFFLV